MPLSRVKAEEYARKRKVALRMWDRGERARDIADKLGVFHETVRRWARKAGKTRQLGWQHRPISMTDLRAQIAEAGSIAEAARRLQITPQAITNRLAREPGRRSGPSANRYSDETKDKAVAMYVDGYPLFWIEGATGAGRSTILKWVYAAGHPPRSYGPLPKAKRPEVCR